MEFQVFQRPEIAASEPVLWTVANSTDIVATGSTPPLGPNEQVPVAVADLAAGLTTLRAGRHRGRGVRAGF